MAKLRFKKVVGCSAFSLAQYPEDHIRAFIQHVKSRGYNTIRVLSETGHWDELNCRYLPAGPRANTPAAKRDVRKLLRVSEQERIWVELVSSGTIKHLTFRFQNNWARKVAKLARPYKHVFLNAMNEPQQSSMSESEVLGLIRTLRAYSGLPTGVDAPCEAGHWRFPRKWKAECDWIGMHPRRNPDLVSREIKNVVNLNGLVLFNETTSYISDDEITKYRVHVPNALFYNNGMPKQGKRKSMARAYMRRFKRIPQARWYFHMLAGLHCQDVDFWMPVWKEN